MNFKQLTKNPFHKKGFFYSRKQLKNQYPTGNPVR